MNKYKKYILKRMKESGWNTMRLFIKYKRTHDRYDIYMGILFYEDYTNTLDVIQQRKWKE